MQHLVYKREKSNPITAKNSPRQTDRTPHIKTLLLQAIRWKALLESGRVSDQAEIARYEGLSRARVTQIMKLLNLAPEIQNHILNMPKSSHRPDISERSLRHITQLENKREQVAAFQKIIEK
jgi:hypothetical protein